MNKITHRFRLCILSALMLLIVFDSRTALYSISKSMKICMTSVIPGVFPFIFLGSAIASELKNTHIAVLEQLLRIPKGSAGFFLIGLLCGYPVGAKLLQDAADRNSIEKSCAVRMVSFCNNASPAFIIGILSSLFSNGRAAISMWIIQIVSSLILGIILPGKHFEPMETHELPEKNIGTILKDTIVTLASICGWVIIFGMCLSYMEKIAITAMNPILKVVICGTVELTNGIFMLGNIRNEAVRFVLSGVLLSFGGFCVLLQTRSVAPDISCRQYLQARLLHATISAALSSLTTLVLFPIDTSMLQCIPLLLCAAIISCLIPLFNKKMIAIRLNL